MPGPPRTPREVRRRRGTLRADRDPEAGGDLIVLAPTESAGAVPHYADGAAMLQSALDSGASRWIGATDWPTAALARQLWDERELARQRWTETGSKQSFDAYNELTKRLQACLSRLGLDPAARASLGVAEVKARSVLEELKDRRRAKAGRRAT